MIKASFQLRTIGQLLKERRRERKLTIGQISEITKIRTEYLKALEEGDYNLFPSEVYLKGFLKNYSKFLNINTERALAMYRRERDYKNNEPTIAMATKIKERGFDLTITPGKLLALFIVTAITATVFYIGSYIGRVFKDPELAIVAPVSTTAKQEQSFKTQEEAVTIEGKVEIGSRLTINGQEYKTNNFERFTEEFKLQPGVNRFVFEAESQFGRKVQLTLNIVRESNEEIAGPEASPTPTPSATVAGTNTIGITGSISIVNRDASVEIKSDGAVLINRVLAVGSNFDFNAASTVEIFTPRPDTVLVTLNGKQENLAKTYTKWEVRNGQLQKI